MAVFELIGGERRLVKLDPKPFNSGFSAEIFHVDDTGRTSRAAKIYRSQDFATKRRAKIAAMIGNDPRQRNAGDRTTFAWPESMLVDANETFVGFVMPEARDAVSLARHLGRYDDEIKLTFREQALRHRLEVCASLARGVERLHRRGHLVVDFKPQNLLVYRGSTAVCFVDCDGFGISGPDLKFFPGGEITPGYAARELFASPTRERSPTSAAETAPDRFTLAVIIFEMLARVHPFDGIAVQESQFRVAREARIRDRVYPYGACLSTVLNPPADSQYVFLSPNLRALLDRGLSAQPSDRPKPEEWVRELTLARDSLHTCSEFPTDPRHVSFPGLTCVECAYEALFANEATSEPKTDEPRKPENPIPQPPRKRPWWRGWKGLLLLCGFLWVIFHIFTT